MIESELCDTCQPYTRQKARTTSESTDDKQPIKSSGRPSRGCSFELCSCPLHREVASGAAIFPKWLPILRDLTTGADCATTSTLSRQAVTLCACRATGQNFREKFCVLDADNKVIIAHRETFAGAASRKRNERTSSTGKNSDNESKTATTKKGAGSTTPEKKSGTGSG